MRPGRRATVCPAVATRLGWLVVVALVACGQAEEATAPDAVPESSLRADVQALIAASGAEVAVAMRTLDGEDELLIDHQERFHAASTMKVPVMIELFKQQAAGELSLDDPLEITNTFSSIVDGSPYSLSVEDDSDDIVYSRLGSTMSLRELCEVMITVSSNLATNLLIEHLDVERIRATVLDLDAAGMDVVRGVEDIKAFEAGRSNSTDAEALLRLFEALGHATVIDEQSSQAMVDILERQQFRDGIPAGLPEGTRVAHKTGSITRIRHDAGIVFGPRPFVLVVLVRGLDDPSEADALTASIARRVFDEVSEGGRSNGAEG